MITRANTRLLFLVTEDWYFWWNRLDLAKAARDQGFEVLVATNEGQYSKRIADEGLRLHPIRLSRRGRNPFTEFATFYKLIRLYRQVRPDIVHHVAIKPVLYGSLAAQVVGLPAVVNTFAGLGHVFVTDTMVARVIRCVLIFLLRIALRRNRSAVIFQNDEDRADLIKHAVVTADQSIVIRGSGVDISKFIPVTESPEDPIVLFAGRMLRNKGIKEFVEAGCLLRRAGVRARFILVGIIDEGNPASVSENEILAWQKEGIVQWWGATNNMPAILSRAHVVVLPTYYGEGLPKILLEAAACGRPIVTTNTRGCRDIVRHGDNGYLVPPHDSPALADAIGALLNDDALRQRMGARGHQIVSEEFSSAIVTGKTLEVYKQLLPPLVDALSV